MYMFRILILPLWINAQDSNKIDQLEQELKSASKKDKPAIYLEIANNLFTSDPKLALKYANSAQSAAKDQKLKDIQADALDIMGRASELLKDQKNAIKYYEEEVTIRETLAKDVNLAKLYFNLANMYKDDKKDKKATAYYEKSLPIALKFQQHSLVPTLYEALFSLDYNLGKYKEAIEYFKKYMVIKDSVYVTKKASEIAKIKTNYETKVQKQNEQIGNLNKINTTISAQFDSTNHQKDAQIGQLNVLTEAQKEEIKYNKLVISQKERERIYFFIIFGFGLTIIILLIFGYFSNRKKNIKLKLQYEELELQKEEITTQRDDIEMKSNIIAQKNKDITNSIQYALRIQQAILPTDDELNKVLKDFFVMYKPKDIVSGDFYWISTTNDNRAFLVVADCTGHGVPGGFMSMIGTLKLNEIVNNDRYAKLLHPAFILVQLDQAIRKSLHQTDSMFSTQDGMDIAVCEFDFAQKKMYYSGANNPLWCCRKDGTMVEHLPTRKGLGGHYEGNLTYKDSEVPLEPGDMFYMFSDGLEDQFGGPERKKLMKKNMRVLFGSMHDKQIGEQHSILERYFEEWKNTNDQVDDVLVFGFKSPIEVSGK